MFVLADARKEYPDVYRKCLNVTRKNALIALNVPTTKQNKIRASMDLVSIIIPAYNVDDYLKDCVHSILHENDISSNEMQQVEIVAVGEKMQLMSGV